MILPDEQERAGRFNITVYDTGGIYVESRCH